MLSPPPARSGISMATKLAIIALFALVFIASGVAYWYYGGEDVIVESDVTEDEVDEEDTTLEDILDSKPDYSAGASGGNVNDAIYSTSAGNIEFEKIWDDSGSGADLSVAVWRPTDLPNYTSIGDITSGDDNAVEDTDRVLFVSNSSAYSALPTNYKKIWSSEGVNLKKPIAFWEATCPDQYRALGHVASEDVPDQDASRCVHESLLEDTDLKNTIWESKSAKKLKTKSGAPNTSSDVGIWSVWGSSTFMAGKLNDKPKLAYRFKG